MENFIGAIRAICFVSAGICIVQCLTDGTKLRGQAEMLLKLIFAVTVTAAIVSGSFSIELPDINSFYSTDHSFSYDEYDSAVIAQTSENISAVLREQLSAAGITTEKIETEVNISAEGSISINRVIISTADFEAAADIIRGSLGQETEVINERT